jgi:hypothetical protein
MDRPVFVTAGTADEIVPVEVVERFVAELGAAGNSVRYRRFDGASHADVLGAGLEELVAWTGDPTGEPAGVRASVPFDADGDGRLTLDDYEVFALRLVQSFGEPPGSPAAAAVRDGYRALWRAVAARADVDEDGAVSPEEFRDWLGSTQVDAGFEREIRPLAESVIALADADRDGCLTAAELARLSRACEAPGAAVLDRDHDGVVSAGELIAAVRDFCRDPAPGRPGETCPHAIPEPGCHHTAAVPVHPR